ncbi:GIY-YIG nuclease family protein [Echinicola salinicaeni]|uniref:GIY-YIG nuclease family protein n=1 Tax=Echinicola salinicaeni TaxID=2762757 RepID=UPI001E54DDD7|nr:GIY-YIG nuclease family protein [Echinicola salinicaeni]
MKKLINEVPDNTTGVYYLWNERDRIIYIGKSKNIRARLYQHFSNNTNKAQRMQKQTVKVTFENMGNELIALLRESEQIKFYQPVFNRAQRRAIFIWGIFMKKDDHGYKSLYLDKIDKKNQELMSFSNKSEGKEFLFRITEKYVLCQKINGLYPSNASCFQYTLRMCKGACIKKEDPLGYNRRVAQFLDEYFLPKEDKLIVLAGRKPNEKGIILIENGVYKGYGFINDKPLGRDIKSHIQAKTDNKETQRLIRSFLKKEGL